MENLNRVFAYWPAGLIKMHRLALIGGILMCLTKLFGQSVTIPQKKFQIGDTIEVSIRPTASHSPTILNLRNMANLDYVKDTTLFEAMADLEIIDTNIDSLKANGSLLLDSASLVNFSFVIYSPGLFKLTNNPILRDTISVLPPDSLSMREDIRDVLPIFEADEYYGIWILLLVLFLVLTYLFIRWFKNRKRNLHPLEHNIQPEMILSPAKKAMEALRALQAEKKWPLEEVKDFQSRLTDIVKTYLSETLITNAESLTSDELCRSYAKNTSASELVQTLSALLGVADLIKFAKASTTSGIFDATIEQALFFIGETEKKRMT